MHLMKNLSSLFLISLLLFGCRSGELKNNVTNTAYEAQYLLKLKALTTHSINYKAQYAKQQNKILFISRARPKHSHPQLYELNFDTSVERRITYQDGEIYDGIYAAQDNAIYYSSTTDEIKENPNLKLLFNANAAKNGAAVPSSLPQTEIYESQIDGLSIRRLTESPNFDGYLSLRPGTQEITFVSTRNSQKQLFHINATSRHTKILANKPSDIESPNYSRDGKQLLFVKQNIIEKNKTSDIWLTNHLFASPQALVSDGALNIDPAWHPNGEEFVFAANRDGVKENNPNNFDLYIARIDGTCIRRLTSHIATERWPQFSPNGMKILFTSDRSGSMQIYEADYVSPPCIFK